MRIPVWAKRLNVGAAGERRHGEPVTFGVPLPAGAVHDESDWSITDASNITTPVQVRPLDRWPDGSVRWALIDARVDSDGSGDTPLQINCGDGTAPMLPALVVTERPGAVVVDTGAARFVIRT